jgi:DNA-binding GntR family transcriptional regulator
MKTMSDEKQVSQKHKVYTQLRDEIVFGRLLPGEHIKEAWWAQKFECSRGPIREAFNQLERQGFLQLTPNQGAVVMKTSSEDVKDYYGLLKLLEGKAVEWATPFLTSDDIEKLAEINKAMKKIPRDDKRFIELWIPLNREFHSLFRLKCGNNKMDWIIEDVRMRMTRYRYTSLVVTAIDEYLQDHDRIIKAVRKGDGLEAGKAMATHICRAEDVLMEFFARFPVP